MRIRQAERLRDVGEYYFSRKQRDIASLNATGDPVINLGIGSPDLAPAPEIVATLSASARAPNHHGYQSYRGIPELRHAVADWYRRCYGVALHGEDNVLPLIGSKEGVFHVSMALLDPGDEVLIPNPGYPTYTSVCRLVGATPRFYDLLPENGWLVDVAALERTDLSRVRLLWVNYPNMPTGARASPDVFRRLIALGRRYGFPIVNDNPYGMVNNDRPVSLLQCPDAGAVALELGSLSKSHNMAGWRVGWIAGSSEWLDAVLKVKSNIDSGMFLPIQHAAVDALKSPGAWYTELNRVYRERGERALSIFDLLGCSYAADQVGMFKWARVPDAVADVPELVERMLCEARVFITPGGIFGSQGERYLRISLCADLAVYATAWRRLRRWLGAQPPRMLGRRPVGSGPKRGVLEGAPISAQSLGT